MCRDDRVPVWERNIWWDMDDESGDEETEGGL